MIEAALGLLAVVIWAYLLLGRGGFWLADQTDADPPAAPATWPAVTAVVPARDEADVIAAAVDSLLSQDYPGPFNIILVDDDSSDGTAQRAQAAADAVGGAHRLQILRGAPLPAGWTGKLWAVSQGVAKAAATKPKYLLLTDADIAHEPDGLRHLVSRAEAGGLALTSLMAELHCKTFAERLLIPAFVLFFQMVYPFRQVNRADHPLAAAAGGCMLAQREALTRAGGVAAIRTAVIDDCAMGAIMKRQGPIWLGLTRRARSLRPYPTVGAIGRMVSRSAYAQLDYSPIKLAGTLLGLALLYLLPPALAVFGSGPGRWAGLFTWGAMALCFQPMLRFYRRSPLWGLALPFIGALYAAFTLRSALQVWRGAGGQWKGRAQALARTA
ncbi:MAG: glycosyl transferase family 2 [Phenylobacterium sp.]|uniref:glycosyltransferase n=1 Tax=Phenylobacterium sp. TaxID=1871053 RepID=UPI0026305970|nr:glycosyltransferase [Phenylobacterium sp.]MDB5500095.1 glycosyl transferase family 2 [Phenylobacterium sp.]